jgi:hypothetical protein
MEDVLDFSADFWEKRLDYEPENVDNIYSKKGISYAIDDYCGFDPVSQWVQTPPEEEGQLPAARTSKGRGKGRTKGKGVKHHTAKS